MIQYDETRLAMEALTPQIEELKGALNLEGLKIKVEELEMKSTEPNFWDDPEKAQAVQQQIGQYKNTIDSFNRMKTNHDDVLAMIELAEEENDESAVDEVKELAEKVKSEFEEQKLATLLTGEYDSSNAILTFHAGAGGTEAQDWVSMLLRMYMKWADRHGFKTEILDMLDGEEAGIKSASIHIQGFNAYGFLKSENGVHRLVRVSPFDAQGRRHTSFASVEVMPEIERTFPLRSATRISSWKCSVRAARAVSTSTRPPRRSDLSISLQVLLLPARLSVRRYRTAISV